MIFNTLYEDSVWEVFAFMKTTTDFYYIQVEFEDREEFYDMAREIKERSLYDTGIEIAPEDRILILSTCTNQAQNIRYVLAARLARP